jgi:hypothetical protein
MSAGPANLPRSRSASAQIALREPVIRASLQPAQSRRPRAWQSHRAHAFVISATLHLALGLVLAVWSWRPVSPELPLEILGGLTAGDEPVAWETTPPILLLSAPEQGGSDPVDPLSRLDPQLQFDAAGAPAPITGPSAAEASAAPFETAQEGDVAFFGSASTARSFVFVVDLSGSMLNNRRFDRMVRELTATINALQPDQQFSVVFFNDQPLPLFSPRAAQGLIDATRSNKQRAIRWIKSRKPDGLTNPDLALEMALAMRPGAIYFLTDGEILDADLLIARLARWNTVSTPIHTLAFESRDGEDALIRIARDSGGTYRFVR